MPVAPNARDKFPASDSESTFNKNQPFSSPNANNLYDNTATNNNQSSPLYKSNEQSSPQNQPQKLQNDFNQYNSNSQLDNMPIKAPPKKLLPQGLIRDRKNNDSKNASDNMFLNGNDSVSQFHDKTTSNSNNYNHNTHFSNQNRKVSNAQQYLHSSNESLPNQFDSNKTSNNNNMNKNLDYNGESMYNNSSYGNNINSLNSKHLSPSPSPPLSMQQQQLNIQYQNSPSTNDYNNNNNNNNNNNFSDFEDYNSSSNNNRINSYINQNKNHTNLNNNNNNSRNNNNNSNNYNSNNNNNNNKSNNYNSNNNSNNYNNNSNEFNLIENERGAAKKPEKLFSARLNQRMMPNNNSQLHQGNQMGTGISPPPPSSINPGPAANRNFQNPAMVNNNNNSEFADDAISIHSHVSCVSKLSSSSVQSELLRDKGANRRRSTLITNSLDQGIPEYQSQSEFDMLGQTVQAIESLQQQSMQQQQAEAEVPVQTQPQSESDVNAEGGEVKPKKKKGKDRIRNISSKIAWVWVF